MKKEDLKNLSIDQLKNELEKALKDLYKIRLAVLTYEEKNHSLYSKKKKYVARIKTLINLKR